MALQFPSISFIAGLIVLFWLFTFVVFAILRVATGVSIQRLGLSSLRHISYTPKEGLKVEVRGLGLQVHRPTFAQPTWLSVVITELRVTLDLAALKASKKKDAGPSSASSENGSLAGKTEKDASKKDKPRSKGHDRRKSAQTFARLTEIKERVKRLHRIIPWLRLVDLVAHKSSFVVLDVGTLQIGSINLSVDTRRTTVDRNRIFRHRPRTTEKSRPAEWAFTARSVLFTAEDKESVEILDHCHVNIHGFLHPDIEGLRDAHVSLKLGRLHLPYDDLRNTTDLARQSLMSSPEIRQDSEVPEVANQDEDLDQKAHEESVLQALDDAKGFLKSIMRGIHEVSFSVGFVGLSKRVDSIKPAGAPLYINMSVKELGMDLYRLDPATPAHSTYFTRQDVAHQALISALSISMGLDDGQEQAGRIVYIPMTTITVRTTLPAKLLQLSRRPEAYDRNTNVFFANLVVTSPSIDLDPHHLPLFFAVLKSQPSSPSKMQRRGHHIVSQLLPKATIKLHIHEPVTRVALPPSNKERSPGSFDFDLLVSAISSISLDIDSLHSSENGPHYSLSSILRIASHRLYYQTAMREQHDLIITESMELKTQVTAAPTLSVVASADLKKFSTFMVRPEINDGIRQIVRQLRADVMSDKLQRRKSSQENNFMRTLPPWLQHFHLQASDFNFEIAGTDSLSAQTRGFAVHLDSWTTEYLAHKDNPARHAGHKRRGSSSFKAGDVPVIVAPSPLKGRQSPNGTDGRRVIIHVKGLEAFIVQLANSWEKEPFLSLARSEVTLTAGNDGHSPYLHLNTHTKTLFVQHSLFKHYCIGVAATMLRQTFSKKASEYTSIPSEEDPQSPTTESSEPSETPAKLTDFLILDARADFIQVKMLMPTSPHLIAHFSGFQACRHRFTNPFARCEVIRAFAESPSVPKAWNRMIGIKEPRIDLRESVKKVGSKSIPERSIDFSAEVLRIGVPHQLTVYKIFDNIVNTAKTVAQLHHRFKTDSNEYILAKHPEGPKNVPKISVRIHLFLFEIEDSAFEWKLSTIFRAGLVEQKLRIAREAAFHQKCQHLQTPHAAKFRSPSAGDQNRGQSQTPGAGHRRDTSDETINPEREGRASFETNSRRRHRSTSGDRRGRRFRYTRDGQCGISGNAKTTIHEAWEKVQRYNAQSWKNRITHAQGNWNSSFRYIRKMMGGMEAPPPEAARRETFLTMPDRPALLSVLVSDLNIRIGKPSFPLEQLPDFMHRVGKGLPKDTKFGLLVPLNAQFEMGEARVGLRDYPLPLLHIPPIKSTQSTRLPAWSLKTDFVIGEEFNDQESTRDIQVTVVPAELLHPDDPKGPFAVDVRRTVMPVKTYSEIKVEINTARDSRFTWGTSYQPAIQDMMQVIEGFTKPPVDPSEKVGFWDKLRLCFHSTISVAWKGDGNVHLTLKGSRDPYVVTGFGTGFVMVWRNDVRWNIWQDESPTKFTTVDSGEFILAIPDFNPYARALSQTDIADTHENPSFSSNRQDQQFKKTIMKLSGKIRWLAGLVFEQNLPNGERSFEFEPHWKVILRNPAHAKAVDESETYDAYKGFRSNHIHMSISIAAPCDRDWSLSNLEPASNYNSIHLTPRFFTHFYSWWGMFSGAMSLPIRHGPLFPNTQKSNKKFGRHLATIKYSLLLSPLYLAHVYKHKEAEEFSEDVISATGLKVKLDSFLLDVHQRREEFEIKGVNKNTKSTHMKMNQALIDLASADIRAISASMTGTSLDSVHNADAEKLAGYGSSSHIVDLSKFTIPDNDFGWIDVDDFVEVDWALPVDSDPETKILPLAFFPRFTYRRQTDHENTIAFDTNRHSPFGYEKTHDCLMDSDDNDARLIQISLLENRLARIEEHTKEHEKRIDHLELEIIRRVDAEKQEVQKQLEEAKQHSEILRQKKYFTRKLVQVLKDRVDHNDPRAVAQPEEPRIRRQSTMSDSKARADGDEDDDDLDYELGTLNDMDAAGAHVTKFNNRFVIHNAQIKWNNALRNIILRYIHQVSQRRGFVYYTSRRAVKFILDIIEEQQKTKSTPATKSDGNNPTTPGSPTQDDDAIVQDRIAELLADGKRYVDADDPDSAHGDQKNSPPGEESGDVTVDFTTQNTYHVRLIAPQIQLQSDKNPKATVLVTARGMRLKVFQIMDKERVSDNVSGLVQRRFLADMDSMQFFASSKDTFSTEYLHMYSGNRYGNIAGSLWPPWVPIEVMFNFNNHSYGFHRVVQRTSAAARYDKYNKLRLKYNDHVSDDDKASTHSHADQDSQMDHLWVEFPQLRAICDSTQYYAMYIIVLDLLLYNEPLEKSRNERLERIMLASDFTDLRGAPEMVIALQDRIRQLEEIKTHFHVNEKFLDRKGWADRISLEHDLSNCEDELFFIMKAITTAQRKTDDRNDDNQTTGLLRYNLSSSEIVWHLMKEADSPLVEFQLGNATYERTDNSDGSNQNAVQIDYIHGLNLLPNAVYPEIIAPYVDDGSQNGKAQANHPYKNAQRAALVKDIRMLRVDWLMLEPIAGIPVVDRFQVNLHPLKIELEREIGQQLFEYVFPGSGNGEENFSPFMVRHRLPEPGQEGGEGEDGMDTEARKEFARKISKDERASNATGTGSLFHRLQPTLRLADQKGKNAGQVKRSSHGLGLSMSSLHVGGESSMSRAMHESRTPVSASRSSISVGSGKLTSKGSEESLGLRGRRDSKHSLVGEGEGKKKSRFGFPSRSNTTRSESHESKRAHKKEKKKSGDLEQMMNRASNYMTLSYVQVPSVVLCLSYKGRGQRNVEDVHMLVFRMPTLEYRNKTWSNMDIALALKKDVIKALISHTGTILSNKFIHHKPGRHIQSRLREIASSSAVISHSTGTSQTASANNSLYRLNSLLTSEPSPRPSVANEVGQEEDDEGNASQDGESYASSMSQATTNPDMESTETAVKAPGTENGAAESSNNNTPNRHILSRHLSEFTLKVRRKDSAHEDGDDLSTTSPGRKGTIKKILNSVRH